ncbi:protein eva-1 homolog C-like [Tubulanus polymorphus]|uniref:protein eva-1 homolog C-like n=1 Tax=Tubulanus polymorphus TaxID=672921 RepID=UPI003DA4669C
MPMTEVFIWLVLLSTLSFMSGALMPDSRNSGILASTLFTFKKHACRGNVLNMRCPKGTTILVQFAHYGRRAPSSQVCPIPPGVIQPTSVANAKEDTQCLAKTSLRAVVGLCEDKRRCKVEASSDVFGRTDPCPGTTKYLEVNYKCKPTEFDSKIVCEGHEMVIQCTKRSHRIAIYSATYGRMPRQGNSKCPAGRDGIETDCQAEGTVDIMMRRCHGKKRCQVSVDRTVFKNDPCPMGTRKYLSVIYVCVPKKILKVFKGDPVSGGHVHSNDDASRDQSVNPDWGAGSKTKPSPTSRVQTYPNETAPSDSENCNNTVSAKWAEFTIGFITDWISTARFISDHSEKAILYFVLGACGGLLLVLFVVIFKIVAYVRKRKSKMDVTDTTTAATPNGISEPLVLESNSSLPVTLERTFLMEEPGSIETTRSDGAVEVIRYNSRVPLRSSDPIGTRTLNHYYT